MGKPLYAVSLVVKPRGRDEAALEDIRHRRRQLDVTNGLSLAAPSVQAVEQEDLTRTLEFPPESDEFAHW